MTELLVSVRNAKEAAAAWRGGATLIDVKEPNHGPLGCADAHQWHAVVRVIAGRVPVSVALGELREASIHRRGANLPRVAFAKCGLAHCRELDDWPARWQSLLQQLSPTVGAVAVLYVDWQAAGAPAPQEVLKEACRLRCRAVLWDTFDKARGSLLDHIPLASLAQMVEAARQNCMLVALAGSLTTCHFPEVLTLSPDYIAVRGAACEGRRNGPVRSHLVRELADAIRACRPASSVPC